MNGDEVFNDHVVKFKLSDNVSVLFLKLLSLLDHKLLDIVVGLIGRF